MIKIFCDKCGQEIITKDQKFTFGLVKWQEVDKKIYCSDCYQGKKIDLNGKELTPEVVAEILILHFTSYARSDKKFVLDNGRFILAVLSVIYKEYIDKLLKVNFWDVSWNIFDKELAEAEKIANKLAGVQEFNWDIF